jgi:hypothetical protein
MLIDGLSNSDSPLCPLSASKEGSLEVPSLILEKGFRDESKKQNIPTQYLINNNPLNIPTVLLWNYCINRRKNYSVHISAKLNNFTQIYCNEDFV